jgi:hypothetical protein
MAQFFRRAAGSPAKRLGDASEMLWPANGDDSGSATEDYFLLLVAEPGAVWPIPPSPRGAAGRKML